MSVLAFTGDRNTPPKNDYSGAFKPEARRFVERCGGGRQVEIDLSRPPARMRKDIIDTLRSYVPPDGYLHAVAFFCHGQTHRIQLGFDRAHVQELAEALAARGVSTVGLYACSTAAGPGPGGDGGFADGLRDALCVAGMRQCRVLAHKVAGHTSKNRFKLFFDGMGSPVGGTGGYELVTARSPLWKEWSRRMGADKDALRFECLFMSIENLHRALQGLPASPVVISRTPPLLGPGS